MKDIGRTKSGGFIIEMEEVEYAQLSMLVRAVEGKAISDIPISRMYEFQNGFDFTKTFGSIRAFYELHFRVNELQGLINEIRESLNE